MKPKNYTTKIPATRTIAQIEDLLIEIGATNVNKEIDPDTRNIKAITFLITNPGKDTLAFKLEPRINSVFRRMMAEYKRPGNVDQNSKQKQAERAAWRTVFNLIEAQVEMIIMDQSEPLEMLLGFYYDHGKGETLFQRIQNNQKLLKQA